MADNNAGKDENGSSPPVEHVLHVADADVLARFGPMFSQVAQGLCASGVRTTLVTDDAEMIARLEGTPVECLGVRHLGGWWAWGLDRFLSSRVSPAPDVVHLWGTAGLWWVQRWARRAGLPLLVHALGTAHVDRLIRSGLRSNHHVVVASGALATPLLKRFPLALGRCRTIPPAITPPICTARERVGDHTFSVLCVSRFGEHSGLDLLIDAAAQLRRDECDLQVALVGEGPGAQAVWRQIRCREVRGCVSLIDEPKLWEKVLPEIDVYVVPACQRELSIVPLLAMGLGKIVIASRDQIGEWFIEDRTAWEFTPGSAVELAYLLARAIEQPKHAHELSAAAAEYVRAHHSVREMVAELVAFYGFAIRTGGVEDTGGMEKSGGDDGA